MLRATHSETWQSNVLVKSETVENRPSWSCQLRVMCSACLASTKEGYITLMQMVVTEMDVEMDGEMDGELVGDWDGW